MAVVTRYERHFKMRNVSYCNRYHKNHNSQPFLNFLIFQLSYWAQSFHCQQFDPHTLPSDPGIGDNSCIGSRTAVNMPSFPGVLPQMRDSTPGYQYVATTWLDLQCN